MSDELKPVCCGCGGEAFERSYTNTFHTTEDGYDHTVYCSKCNIETKMYDTEVEAIQAWNTAMGERTAKATRKPEAWLYRCECGYGLCFEKNDINYCPSCGAKLEWK